MFCYSPDFSGVGRCSQKAVGQSKHCAQHAGLLKSIYLQYKSIDIGEELWYSLEQLKELGTEKLTEILNKIKSVYDLRAAHRRLGFIKELWDRGHDYAIEKCVSQMLNINLVLETQVPTKSVIESVIKEESDWEDSAAIAAYRDKQRRIEISYNIARSHLSKLIPTEKLNKQFVVQCIDAFINTIMVLKETKHYIKYSQRNYRYKFRSQSKCPSCEDCLMAKLSLFISFIRQPFGHNVIDIFCRMIKSSKYNLPKQVCWELIGEFEGKTIAELRLNQQSEGKIIIKYVQDRIESAKYYE